MRNIQELSLEELTAYLNSVRVPRGVREVVLHHTWSPTAAQYKGKATWEAIRQYHVNVRGWSDIGYHLGVGPDGTVWRLRPVARQGAHVLGRNEHTVGVAMVGNFDVEDPVENGLETAARVFGVVLGRFGLSLTAVRFHREFQQKTCPGLRIDLEGFRNMVAELGREPIKVVRLPDSTVIACRPEVISGVTRCDLRALAEALGAQVTDHIKCQGKVYVRRE